MSLSDMKAFFRWLDEATKEELIGKRDKLHDLLPDMKEDNARNSVKRYLRLIEQELLVRVMR